MKRHLMLERLFVAGVVASYVATVSAQGEAYNTNAVTCAQGGGLGYETFMALNADILAERERVLAGQAPAATYAFSLCPNNAYADGPLFPALDNIVIGCGNDFASADQCVLIEGEDQVVINSYADSDFPVTSVSLEGLTFSSFTGSAVTGVNATDVTSVTIEDAIFSNVPGGEFLVRQTTDLEGERPFGVSVIDSVVRDVTLSGGFSNDGGELAISNLDVENAEITGSLVGVNGNSATLQLQNMDVSDSEISSIVRLQGGADGNVEEMTVQEMVSLQAVVRAEGPGTSLDVRNSNITDIDYTAASGSEWVGFQAANAAELRVRDSTVSGNRGSSFLFSSLSQSTLTIERTNAINNAGGRAGGNNNELVYGVVYANSGNLIYRDSRIEDMTDFTSAILVAFESKLDASGICIDGTSSDAVVFVTADSSIEVSNNAIQEDLQGVTSISSQICQSRVEDGGRMVVENEGSDCFGGGTCDFECEQFAELTTCQQIVESTFSPTAAPTLPLSDPPSNVPTTTAAPTTATFSPTTLTALPTLVPTVANTSSPTTSLPTMANMTFEPTPTIIPAELPTAPPSGMPSQLPTAFTAPPTGNREITLFPTVSVTSPPTGVPTSRPTGVPTPRPTVPPGQTEVPTTLSPTATPTTSPTSLPTAVQTSIPTSIPTISLTASPSGGPTTAPVPPPSVLPSHAPSPSPSSKPSGSPSLMPTGTPTKMPSNVPSLAPTIKPSPEPSSAPSIPPTPSPTKCRPRPIYISPRDAATKGKGKGKGSRRLKSSGKSSSSKGTKGKGKGKGSRYGYYVKRPVQPPTSPPMSEPEEPELPFCDDVFNPIIVSKGIGDSKGASKGKGKGGSRRKTLEDSQAYRAKTKNASRKFFEGGNLR